MKMNGKFKGFNVKKLLLTILCSVIITTSLSLTALFVDSFSSVMVNEALDEVVNEEDKEIPEELIEQGKYIEEGLKKGIEKDKNTYGDDYPSEGILIFRLMSRSGTEQIVQVYKDAILVGITLGTFVYIIGIQKAKKMDLVIESIVFGGIIILLTAIINFAYASFIYGMMKNLGLARNVEKCRVNNICKFCNRSIRY